MQRIVELSPMDIVTLAEMTTRADLQGKSLKVAMSGDGVIFKVGEGMWTAPMGMAV